MFLRAQHRGPQERRDLGRHRAVADEILEADLAQPRAPDADRRPRADAHDRRQARAVGQAQVELRVGRVERPAGQADVRGQHLDEFDQLLVGLGDRLVQLLAAVGVADEDPVAAVDVDVLDVGVVEQRLQPADPEQRGVDRRRRCLPPPRATSAVRPSLISPRAWSSSTWTISERANCRSSSLLIGARPASSSLRRCWLSRSATWARSRRIRTWSVVAVIAASPPSRARGAGRACGRRRARRPGGGLRFIVSRGAGATGWTKPNRLFDHDLGRADEHRSLRPADRMAVEDAGALGVGRQLPDEHRARDLLLDGGDRAVDIAAAGRCLDGHAEQRGGTGRSDHGRSQAVQSRAGAEHARHRRLHHADGQVGLLHDRHQRRS